jgi:hypothetical protein
MKKTYKHPSNLPGVGVKEAKRRLAKLADGVAAGKYGVKTDPEEFVTLSKLLEAWIAHGESRGRSPNTLHGYQWTEHRVPDVHERTRIGGIYHGVDTSAVIRRCKESGDVFTTLIP